MEGREARKDENKKGKQEGIEEGKEEGRTMKIIITFKINIQVPLCTLTYYHSLYYNTIRFFIHM